MCNFGDPNIYILDTVFLENAENTRQDRFKINAQHSTFAAGRKTSPEPIKLGQRGTRIVFGTSSHSFPG